ncbi:MAG: RecQ family ATP-dependent DNA helicase [Cytophagaceae bacterium]|jgi:ATP-dependent DNA helicase RecQ|nr:RecQ family ATP-dependent DNA helicase [Cytophagaceae bacterium]
MATPLLTLLKKYWGHGTFRPLQESIIESILSGHDTIALLPTGGGKSICYQLPALASNGLTLVISPLIALMKDQVDQLKQKGIPALMMHSGMHRREIENVYDHIRYGNYKLVYVSPERVATDRFLEVIQSVKVSFIAVDEAHGISEWGHEFRPAFLKIKEIRQYLPEVPIIALTATATPLVLDDIQEQLELREPVVFQQSFFRKNVSYSALKEENKEARILSMMSKVNGSTIIYARTRSGVMEMYRFLKNKKLPVAYYHGGLTPAERSHQQQYFMTGNATIMVATNAFGMGIDKPDIRLVIHIDLPESIEAYFQEAGRAGRDGYKSFAVLLHQTSDEAELWRKVETAHPSLETIRKVYQALANYYQLAVGSGHLESFDFEMERFSKQFQFSVLEVYHALKRLEQHGIVQLSESIHRPDKIKINGSHEEIYAYRIKFPVHDPLLKQLLRTLGGEVYTSPIPVSLNTIAKELQLSPTELRKRIHYLDKEGILSFIEGSDQPQITFTLPRMDALKLPINSLMLEEKKQHQIEQVQAVIGFLTSEYCRSIYLLDYFGEEKTEPCGICDICIENKKQSDQQIHVDTVVESYLKEKNLPMSAIETIFKGIATNLIIDSLRRWMDKGKIGLTDEGEYYWKIKK